MKNFIFSTKGLLLSTSLTLIIGFLIGYEYRGYLVRSALSSVVEEISNEEAKMRDDELEQKLMTFEEKAESDGEKIIDVALGEDIELATLKVKVLSSEQKDIINTDFGSPNVADEGSVFQILRVELTNTTPSEFEVGSGLATVVDSDGRMFEQETLLDDDDISYDTLKPGIKKVGSLTFVVPEDAADLSVVFSKAGTNETYRVKLDQ